VNKDGLNPKYKREDLIRFLRSKGYWNERIFNRFQNEIW
jgi:hypothetical protein